MSQSPTVLCELTGKPPNDREWICECNACCQWREYWQSQKTVRQEIIPNLPPMPPSPVFSDRDLPGLTGRVIASRLNLVQAARAHVAAYGAMIGKNFILDEDAAAQIILPTSTGPTDHVGMLIVFPGKQLRKKVR